MLNNRVKIILIVICAVIMTSVFIINVSERIQNSAEPIMETTVKKPQETGITRAYLAKMLSLLKYSDDDLNQMEKLMSYPDIKEDVWYYRYINGLCGMDLETLFVESNQNFEPQKKVTFGDVKNLLTRVVKAQKFEELQRQFPTIWSDPEQKNEISWDDFLLVYSYLIDKVYSIQEGSDLSSALQMKELYVVGTDENINSLAPFTVVTDAGQFADMGLSMDEYIDCTIYAYVRDKEILYVNAVPQVEKTLNNVWVVKQNEKELDIFINGVQRTFTLKNPIDQKVANHVADVVVKDKLVQSITLKPDIIRGKVLVAKDDYIELEGYGKIPLDSNYRVYRIYDEPAMEMTNAVLVGYENTDFVVSAGKICAALITQKITAKDIRIILNNSNFTSYYHNTVKVTSDSPFTISYGDKKKSFKAGEEVAIEKSSKYLVKGRLSVKSDKEEGRIKILSLKRSYGNPSYRGTIEVAYSESGFTLVNELPLEEYLYAVIPSEMPTSYGLEALKVQAVCARSYAYNHLVANSCSKYGAHVDDSTKYQVYNNQQENELSIEAVKATYGQVLQYDNEVVFAYYFSTSCGLTADVDYVWASNAKLPYLTGKYQGSDLTKDVDYSDEAVFKKFITSTDEDAYEKEFPWYRWSVSFSNKDLKKMVEANLASLYKSNPSYVLTKDKDGKYQEKYISTVGDIKSITVSKRQKSGLVTEVIISGSKNTVKVKSESFLRQLLSPTYDAVSRLDGSTISNLSLLPSTFFVIEKNKDNKGVTLFGGGYGLGVGMSQNGVKALVKQGKNYETILKHFYSGIALGYIY